MQIKHTFLSAFVFAIAWTGYLFAFSSGPDPGFSGVLGPTCNMSGCHTGNPLNASGGSVSISGLPSEWTPSQTYPLTVTVARSGQSRFGFQLSAVGDSTTQQAGSLAAVGSGMKIVTGSELQFLEHSVPKSGAGSASFTVNWTAPSSASAGTVRFNVAGNAANGDGFNTGDFIYTSVSKVPAASAPPPPPDLSTRAFTMVDRGGVSIITDGSGGAIAGYSRIQPDASSTTPSGVAIFGYRPGSANILVSEAGVPASPLLKNVRIYAEEGPPVHTGLAIANPNDQTATITFHFTDAAGADFGFGSTTIAANEQIAKYLFESPFNASSVQGTFTLTSDVPVSVIALRLRANERNEELLTTLPVTDLLAATSTSVVSLPHFADGGGWTTQIVLVNPTDSTITGNVQFFSQGSASAAGAPATMTANGQTAATFSYTIPRQSAFKLVTAGAGTTPAGSVRVTPTNSPAPSSLVIFSYKPSGITVTEAGVPGIQGTAFRMYVEETASSGIGAIQSGFAIANLNATPTNVTLELTQLDGAPVTQTAVTLPGNGQLPRFLHELFPGLTFPFKGIMRVTGGAPAGLSVVGLRTRTNEIRGDFLITTTPPTNESTPPPTMELLFPQIVNGGGYTTQFILFSGAGGQASSGNLRFLRQSGAGFNLTVN